MRITPFRTQRFELPLLLSVLGLLGAGCQLDADDTAVPASLAQELAKEGVTYDQESILVKFRDTPSVASLSSVLGKVRGKIQDANRDGKDDRFLNISKGRLAQIQLEPSLDPLEAIIRLKDHPAIEYAEPNYIVHHTAIPNDPSFGSLWGLHNTGQSGGTVDADIDAPEAWDIAVGSHEIIVGVVDTGIDYNHPDLAANIWINPGEIPGNGIDDDGNGYIDDIHGINAINNSGNPFDDNDHGTHVAGTIGAIGNNGLGVAGVNWNVSLIGLKFLSASGSGTTADAIESINYAVDLKLNRGVDIRALNNSWGGGGFSQALLDSIVSANAADILFVAAAGNAASNNDTSASYPANYDVPNVLSVASTTRTNALSSFSNYGATTVDLGAPGSDILSTIPGGGFATFSGTSMATPHVTGAAALLLSVNPTLSTAELKNILINSGDSISSLAGKTVSGKRLNVANAIQQVGPPEPSFRLNISPTTQTVIQGEVATYAVAVSSVLGFNNLVDLSLSANPSLEATVTFVPNPVTPDSAATLTIATSAATAAGTYNLTVTGRSSGLVVNRSISLTVRPEGTVENTYTNSNPIAIPDNNPTGIVSTINVPDSIAISELRVAVDITHTYVGDLIVRLTSPEGTTVVLHDHSGGSADDIRQTYAPIQFQGQNALGTWTLQVSDTVGIDVGTLNSWSLIVTGVAGGQPGNERPTADFNVTTAGLTASFVDASTDVDGIIVAYHWDFGDGATSSQPSPTHTYAAAGAYNVALTVTDDAGGISTVAKAVQVGSVVRTFTERTQVAIPDNRPAGIASTIQVPDALSIEELSVSVDITHTYIGDLIVSLTSPEGTVVTLHNRSGGSTDNLNQTYTPVEYVGQISAGTWTLRVSDNARSDRGTLVQWSLTIAGVPVSGR